jgi:uncharacterized protein YutE (UPF0331/DUF86 family)
MDRELINQKLESLRRALQRVSDKCPKSVKILASDFDAQDIVSLNLTRAVQLCIDIGSHLIACTDYPPPTTMGQVFEVMNKAGFIDAKLTERMKKAVGFRNLAVHNYDAINWAIVYAIATQHLDDFKAFARAVVAINGMNALE